MCNGTAHFKNVNNCLITNIYSYLETSGGRSSNLYINVVIFFNTYVNLTPSQPNTIVFLHWCLMCAVLLQSLELFSRRRGGSIIGPAWNRLRMHRLIVQKYFYMHAHTTFQTSSHRDQRIHLEKA